MKSSAPLFANDRTAARLLDMKPKEFCELVEAGHLPKPFECGGISRWDVEQLVNIWRGEASDGMSEVKW